MFVYNRAELYKERHRLFVLTGHCQSASHVVVQAYHLTSYAALSSGIHICYLPAGRSIKVKMLLKASGNIFKPEVSFSLYKTNPTPENNTFIFYFSCSKLVLITTVN